jgi:triphosphoribosyl-dephospho-CoA synthase
LPGPGELAQAACLLEVTARKPGNVHRHADLPDLQLIDFLLSAAAIRDPFERAEAAGVGTTVLAAIEATRRVVKTNTNLGIVLLLAPLAAVPATVSLDDGISGVLAATTVDDARLVYRAIRRAVPGGLGKVEAEDVASEPTMPLRDIMALAAHRDLVARQYANGFHEVLHEALPALRLLLNRGVALETSIVATYLNVLARHPDSLIARKFGAERAARVSERASELGAVDWWMNDEGRKSLAAFDAWLRAPDHRWNPGTTADLVTAALYAALREGTINWPLRYSSEI